MKSPSTEYAEAYDKRRRELAKLLKQKLQEVQITLQTHLPDEMEAQLKDISVASVLNIVIEKK